MSNNTTINVQGVEGMDLRDYLAAKAMNGMLAEMASKLQVTTTDGKNGPIVLAQTAYLIADAMLVAREEEFGK